MRRKSWAAVAIIGAAVLVGTQRSSAGRQQGEETPSHPACSQATLRGSYGIQIQGTRPAPPPAPPGTIESLIGVTIRHYDGNGQFTQISNDKGSVSGIGTVDREGFGTYEVNADCTGTHTLQFPGLPFSITDRFVIVDQGREVRNFVVNPASLMVTGVSKQIDVR